jgi:tryptophan synthase alpha subunit
VKSVIDCGVEGAIVGSAFVKTIEDTLTNEKEMIDRITTLTKTLKTATFPQ